MRTSMHSFSASEQLKNNNTDNCLGFIRTGTCSSISWFGCHQVGTVTCSRTPFLCRGGSNEWEEEERESGGKGGAQDREANMFERVEAICFEPCWRPDTISSEREGGLLVLQLTGNWHLQGKNGLLYRKKQQHLVLIGSSQHIRE